MRFSKKTRNSKRKNKLRSRKLYGGGKAYDETLEQAIVVNNEYGDEFEPEVVDKSKNVSTKWSKDPIDIPKMGTYVGSYYIDSDGIPVMHGHGMLTSYEIDKTTNLPKKIMEGDWVHNKANEIFRILYGDGDVIPFVDLKDGSPFPYGTDEERDAERDCCDFIYSNGKKYFGDLILQEDGKIVPAHDYEAPPSLFSFAQPPVAKIRGPRAAIAKARSYETEEPLTEGLLAEEVVVRKKGDPRGLKAALADSHLYEVEEPLSEPRAFPGPLINRTAELEKMKEIAASQTALPPLKSFSALPSISTRKGGKHRRRKNKNKRKTRRR